MRPFRPRTVRFHGLRSENDWRVKLYSVTHDGSEIEWPAFGPGIEMAFQALPRPAAAAGRPGVGLLIAHHGPTADYVVLGWWDQENELPLRIFVRTAADKAWRPSHPTESVCVWDLEILWFERNAYVSTYLAGGSGDAGPAYESRHAGTTAPSPAP